MRSLGSIRGRLEDRSGRPVLSILGDREHADTQGYACVKGRNSGEMLRRPHAAAYWRERHKQGHQIDARLINTTSVSGIYGQAGQTNYGAAKMGVAGFTIIATMELARYGITVNAIAPGAMTRLTAELAQDKLTSEERESYHPRWVAPACAWLASVESRGVTGRIIEATGMFLAIAEGWNRGPRCEPTDNPEVIGERVLELLSRTRPNAGMDGEDLVTS